MGGRIARNAQWAGYVALGGSYIDEDNVLREPFPLLALGWFFVLAGVATIAVVVVVAIIKRLRTPWTARQGGNNRR